MIKFSMEIDPDRLVEFQKIRIERMKNEPGSWETIQIRGEYINRIGKALLEHYESGGSEVIIHQMSVDAKHSDFLLIDGNDDGIGRPDGSISY